MLETILLQAGQPQGNGWSSWIFIILIVVVFYFFMIRPQQQQQKKLKEERNSMKTGDNVVTTGGVYGKIDGIVKKKNRKGEEEVESFILRVKPEYTTRIQVNRDCVYKDLSDVQQANK